MTNIPIHVDPIQNDNIIQSKHKHTLGLVSLVKSIICCFVLLLPFQQSYLMNENIDLDSFFVKVINYLDEVFGIFLTVLMILFFLLKPKFYNLNKPRLPLIFIFIVFILSTSVALNHVKLLQGIIGIYDLSKNLFLILIFSLIKWDEKDLKKILIGLILIGLILSVSGIFFELLALSTGSSLGVSDDKRLGLYRVESFVGSGNINYLGMYLVLIFYISIYFIRNFIKKLFISVIILITIILTFSRQSLLSLFIILLMLNKKLGILLLLIAVPFFYILLVSSGEDYTPEKYYRAFTYIEALNVFYANPFIGSGPGMFGGAAASLFESPYYNYWPTFYKEMVLKMGSLDSLWPQVLAETGTVGFIFYIVFLGYIYFAISKSKVKINNIIYRKLADVIRYYTVVIIVMGFFTGLNKAFVIITYSLLSGIYLSMNKRRKV